MSLSFINEGSVQLTDISDNGLLLQNEENLSGLDGRNILFNLKILHATVQNLRKWAKYKFILLAILLPVFCIGTLTGVLVKYNQQDGPSCYEKGLGSTKNTIKTQGQTTQQQRQSDNRKVDDPLPIAFTLGQNAHLDLTNGTTLQYNKIITHQGTGSLISGVFTCKEAAVYKFQVFALTKSNTKVWFELYKNNTLVSSIYGHTPTAYADSGNAVILKLSVADTVYVQSRERYNVSLYGTPDQVYTTFTGVRLNPAKHDEGAMSIDPPAFSVALDRHADVAGLQPVKYNKVLLDVNGNYNNTMGSFTVPLSGIYIFHFFSLSKSNESLWQELYNDGHYICSIYGYTPSHYSNSGNTAILHLHAGDKVRVTARKGLMNALYGAADGLYSTFSGAMIADESTLRRGGYIAFSAGISVGYTVRSENEVAFNRVFINLGQHYDPKTGKFTAPKTGIYEFNYHSLTEKISAVWLELYHNFKYVNSLYSHTAGSWAAGGNAAVIELDSGDEVYVKARRGTTNSLFGTGDQIYCTFSGHLIAYTGPSGTSISE